MQSRQTNWIHRVLMVSEVALALILLVGAGLLSRSFWRLLEVDPGFRAERVATVELNLPPARYPTDTSKLAFVEQLLQRLEALPGVKSAAVSDGLPLEGGAQWEFTVLGQTCAPGKEPLAGPRIVSTGYLATMGIAVVKGRGFTDRDTTASLPVVLVSQSLARWLWPHLGSTAHVLGQEIQLFGRGTPFRVVGVVGDVHRTGLDEDVGREIYFLYEQMPQQWITLLVRSTGEPTVLASAIRGAVWSVDRELPVTRFRTMQEVLDSSVSSRRFQLLLLGIFAALALVLAGVGIYGVIAYSVAQRTHEIGIRTALGATPGELRRMVIRQALELVAAGVSIGLVAALALTRVLIGMLFGIKSTDPLTFACVVAILVGVSLLASYIPAWRATKIHPMVALRHE